MKGIKSIVLLFLVMLVADINAQACVTCSVVILGTDTSVYTINANEVFCIKEGGRFKGTLNLNGGTICNSGLFMPKSFVFSSGNIINNNFLSVETSLTFSSGKTMTCLNKGVVNITGNCTISGGTISNNGTINISDNVHYASGNVVNTGIFRCLTVSGSTTAIGNSGIIHKK